MYKRNDVVDIVDGVELTIALTVLLLRLLAMKWVALALALVVVRE